MKPILSDERCQRLLALSDFRTLKVVSERWPSLLPEWQFLAIVNHQFFDNRTMLERTRCEPAWVDEDDLRLEWETLPQHGRFHALLEVLRFWQFTPRHVIDVGAHVGAIGLGLCNHTGARGTLLEPNRARQPFTRQLIDTHAEHPMDLRPLALGDDDLSWLRGDLVFCGEVLEHQWDWRRWLGAATAIAEPGGYILLTTPTGPWESSDPTHPHQHVCHWESDDIHAVFGHLPHFAIATVVYQENDLGAFVWGWQYTPDEQLPAFPIDAKLARYGFLQ